MEGGRGGRGREGRKGGEGGCLQILSLFSSVQFCSCPVFASVVVGLTPACHGSPHPSALAVRGEKGGGGGGGEEVRREEGGGEEGGILTYMLR